MNHKHLMLKGTIHHAPFPAKQDMTLPARSDKGYTAVAPAQARRDTLQHVADQLTPWSSIQSVENPWLEGCLASTLANHACDVAVGCGPSG